MRRKVALIAVLAVAVATALMTIGLNPAAPQTAAIAALRSPSDPGLDPGADEWDDAREVALPLAAQEVTYPFGGGSVAEVRVRALYHDRALYVRLEWDDASRDVRTDEVGQFSDAAAIEFPDDASSEVPAVCMGQAGSGVNIWQWRADRDAGQGRWPDAAFPDAVVDDSSEPTEQYFPAREAGNPVAQPGATAQDLIAQGFGTLGPAPAQRVRAQGRYSAGDPTEDATWTVVFRRPFAKPGSGQPGFTAPSTVDVAFAVWDGEAGERDGYKSVSDFGRLELSKRSHPESPWQGWWFILVPLVILGGFVIWRILRPSKQADAAS